jgi:hypothetical protein
MARKQRGEIVETTTEPRPADPGSSVLSLSVVSLCLAVLIFGGVWYAFFRTRWNRQASTAIIVFEPCDRWRRRIYQRQSPEPFRFRWNPKGAPDSCI